MSKKLEIPEKVRNIIFVVEGGIGKNIVSTAVISNIKKAYPNKKIIVVAGYPDIFLYNPNVARVFNFNNPLYFYDDYVNEDSFVIKEEAYLNYNYITKQKHLIEAWCESIGIDCITKEPELYFLENEEKAAEIYIDKITENRKQELILVQWIGGKIPKDKSPEELKSALASMYRRYLPKEEIEKIVDNLTEKGYSVGVVQHPNMPEIPKSNNVFFPIRSVLILLKYAKTFIGIDSFLQHASASNSLKKRGIVCWGGTSPKVLGYEHNINLTKEVCPTPFCHRPNSYLFDVQPHGAMWDCPYNNKCIRSYTAKEILEVFEKEFESDKLEEITETEVVKR